MNLLLVGRLVSLNGWLVDCVVAITNWWFTGDVIGWLAGYFGSYLDCVAE